MNIDFYTAYIEIIEIPVTDIVCKRTYAVYRVGHYTTPDGYSHNMRAEFFNIYTDKDIVETVVKLIENQ